MSVFTRTVRLGAHLWAAGAAGALGAVGVWIVSHSSLDVAAAAATDAHRDDDTDAWCAPGFSEVARGGCLATPDLSRPDVPLVIYLHGLYEAVHHEKELSRQVRLAEHATRRGYAVLALRSNKGACHPSSEASSQYCWPSNESVADRAYDVVSSWDDTLAETERRVGRGPRFVVGFSSGGYFTSLLLARSLFRADAFVVAHAGQVEPVLAAEEEPPLLLLSASDDPSQQGMRQLDQELTTVGWPHESVTREGGHELTDADIDVTLAFLDRVARGDAYAGSLSASGVGRAASSSP